MKTILLSLLLVSSMSYADDFEDDFADSPASGGGFQMAGLEFTGFVEIEQGANISGTGPHAQSGDNYVMANRRFRLKSSKSNDNGAFYSKVDFVKDDILNETYIDIRELRIKYTPFEWMDLSIGRQVSTWGVADMLFINDLFPKNWVSNFQGRDMEMLKDPSDSLRVTNYFLGSSLDMVYTPQFSPDVTPNGCYFNVYNPNTGDSMKNLASNCSSTRTGDKKDRDFQNGELAAQLKKDIFGQQLALYYYHGFWKQPKGLDVSDYSGFYPKLDVFGASTEGQVGPGIFSAEYGYYDSKDDSNGTSAFIENSVMKFLVGYKMDLSANWSVGFQWYQEWMQDYDEYETSMKAIGKSKYYKDEF
ncbi:MAG: hypothetical protein KAG61_06280, partial [Bacteriovoracaceae bacterium]|nr:hypothetical protein [Bacteriovoracaceae bacterium]